MEFYNEMTYGDIKSGSIVNVQLVDNTDDGMEVLLGSFQDEEFLCSNLRGFIPSVHLSHDKLLCVGDIMKCRVLSVSVEFEMVGLTHNYELVNSPLPIATSKHDLNVNDMLLVYVKDKNEDGLVVGHYNNVKGLIPIRNLKHDVKFPDDFPIGEVLCTRVVSITSHPGPEGLILSMQGDHLIKNVNGIQQPILANGTVPNHKCGQIVDIEIVDKTEDGFIVRIHDDPTQVDIPLPIHHLSDSHTLAQVKFAYLRKGMHLKAALCKSSGVTLKEEIMKYLQLHQLAPRVDELNEYECYPAFVSQIDMKSEQITLPNGVEAVCPGPLMYNDSWKVGRHHLYGQTVLAKVDKIDEEEGLVQVSLRSKDLGCEEEDALTVERYVITQELFKRRFISKKFCVNIGDVTHVEAEVTDRKWVISEVKQSGFHGVFVEGENGAAGKAVVVYVDYTKKEIILTRHHSVLKFANKSTDVSMARGMVYQTVILYHNSDIIVARIFTTRERYPNLGRLVIAPRQPHMNAFFISDEDQVAVGSTRKFTSVKLLPGGAMAGKWTHSDSEGRRPRVYGKLSPSTDVYQSFPDYFEMTEREIKEKLHGLHLGQKVEILIESVRPDCAVGTISSVGDKNGSIKGVIHASNLLHPPPPNTISMASVKPGQTLTCYVCAPRITHMIGGADDDTDVEWVEVSEREEDENRFNLVKYLDDLSVFAASVTAFVVSYSESDEAFTVSLRSGIMATINDYLITNDPDAKLNPDRFIGTSIECSILSVSPSIKLRSKDTIVDGRTGKPISYLRTDCITFGKVAVVADLRLVITLLDGVGRADISDLFDTMVDRPTTYFKPNQIVNETRDLEGYKSSVVATIKVGRLLDGHVRDCSSKGIFIAFARSIVARVRLYESSKEQVPLHDLQKVLYLGRLVKTHILRLTHDGKVEASLKPSRTGIDLMDTSNSPPQPQLDGPPVKVRQWNIVDRDSAINTILDCRTPNNAKIRVVPVPSRDVTCDPGFTWSDDTAPTSDYGSGVEETDEPRPKKRKLAAMKEDEEVALRKREEELMSDDLTPQSATDWERLLVSDPDNSMLWIRYMAFHIHATEVDKARLVAEKALKTINIRKEDEKLNIWVTLLNLENLYGSDDEMTATIRRALSANDQFKLLKHLANIYTQSGKLQKAKETYEKMTKKFRCEKEAWLAYMRHLMVDHNREDVQEILQRCLKGVPVRHHLEVISKVGQLEFKHGDVERGKTIFENLISTHPSRTDVWSVYIDMMINTGRVVEARELFNRVVSTKLSSKKMTSYFRRFVEFERNHGNEATVNDAKQKALDYLNASGR